VQRGNNPPIQADTITALQSALRRSHVPDEEGSSRYPDPGGRRTRGRRGHARRHGRNPRGRPHR
jgi:hypothetical protein